MAMIIDIRSSGEIEVVRVCIGDDFANFFLVLVLDIVDRGFFFEEVSEDVSPATLAWSSL